MRSQGRTCRSRRYTCRRWPALLAATLLLLFVPLAAASGDFDDSYAATNATGPTNTTTATASTTPNDEPITEPQQAQESSSSEPTPIPQSSPTVPTIEPTSNPTLPPHKLHNHCPLKPPHSPPEITRTTRPPLVIGHRGASYNVPEHTLAGYRLALELGADCIEPDLVPTKDGILVAVHSVDLNLTTNVDTVFPNKRRSKDGINGKDSGYYVQDLTLEEVKQLRVRQRVEDTPARSRHFDYLFGVPTLKEIIELLHEWNSVVRPYVGADSQKLGGRAGLYAELKHPAYLKDDAGISIADLFLDELRTNIELTKPLFFDMDQCAHLKADEYQVPPLVVQCFDGDTLTYVREQIQSDPTLSTGSFAPPTVLLLSVKGCSDPDMWYSLSKMDGVSGVGPDKRCLLEKTGEGLGRDFVNSAREHGLAVHAWTERLEVEFVDVERFASAEDELRYLFCDLEIDGIFAENVDVAVRVGKMGCPPKGEEGDSATSEGGEGGKGSGKGSNGNGGGASSEKEGDKDEAGGGEANNPGGGSSSDEIKEGGRGACYESDREALIMVGLGFMAFGLFLGSLFTYWISINCNRRRIRRGATARQVQIPSAEELDMI